MARCPDCKLGSVVHLHLDLLGLHSHVPFPVERTQSSWGSLSFSLPLHGYLRAF